MRPAPNPTLVSVIVACAFFMQNLDGTAIATALPQMAVSFRTNPIALSIGITAYLLTVAVFIPISGWVADRFGTLTVFRNAIAVFTIGSILCGLSSGLWEFTGARVLQGIGGAMMVPVGQLVVLRSTEKQHLLRAMNFLSIPGLVAPVIGPPVGGFITTFASWHWIFFLNVPIGLLGMGLATLFIENHRSTERHPLDWQGFLLTSAALVCLLFALEMAGRRGADWDAIAVFVAVGVILAGLALRHALRHVHPLLDLSILTVRTYAITLGGGAFFRVTVGAAPYLLPLMFQIGFGMTAFSSGMLILTHAAGDLAMKAVTRPILRCFGFRTCLIVNGGLTGMSLLAYCLLTPATPVPAIIMILLLSGGARSLQFTGLTSLSYADIPRPMMSAATTLAGTVQQIAFAAGVAIAAILLQLALIYRGAATEVLTMRDFRFAYCCVAALAFASAFCFLSLPRSAGAEVSGHRPLR